LYVGSSLGAADLYNSYGGLWSTSKTVNNLPSDGRTLYVRLYSRIAGLLHSNDYTYTATAGAKAVMTSPAPGTILPGASTTLVWTTGTGVTDYWLYVGSSSGGHDLYNSYGPITTTSRTVNGLPVDGRTIYVRLFSRIAGAYQFNDYTYGAAAKAVIATPVPGGSINSGTRTFVWSAGAGVTNYWLYVGTSPGAFNIYNSYGPLSTTSQAVPGIPSSGTVYVRLFSNIAGTYYFNDYTYAAVP
jgi:hypothetical protein